MELMTPSHGGTSRPSSPLPPGGRRLVSIGLAILGTLSSSYESLLVDAPSIIDGAWTLIYVVFVSLFVNIPLTFYRWHIRQSQSPLTAYRVAALALKPALEIPAILFVYYAIKHCPVGDAVALFNLSAVWTPLLESVVRRKTPPLQLILAIALTVIGVILISKPKFLFGSSYSDVVFAQTYPHVMLAYTMALCGSLFMSVAMTLVSYHEDVDWMLWQLFFTPVGVVLAPTLVWMINRLQLPNVHLLSKDAALLYFSGLLIGVFNMLAHVLCILAVQADSAATVSITNTLEISFSYALGLLFEDEVPSSYSACGAILLTLAILILADVHLLCKDAEGSFNPTYYILETLYRLQQGCHATNLFLQQSWKRLSSGPRRLMAQDSTCDESWATASDIDDDVSDAFHEATFDEATPILNSDCSGSQVDEDEKKLKSHLTWPRVKKGKNIVRKGQEDKR